VEVERHSVSPDMTKAHDPDGRFGDYQLVNWKTVIGGGMIFKPPQPKRLEADESYIILPGP
jgi:hypothetical protein